MPDSSLYDTSLNKLHEGPLQLVRRLHLPAALCALLLLISALVSRPYADMGTVDDTAYILMAQHLAATGHIVYNGWATAMLGWQLYLGAAFIKLFGFSFSTVCMSTLLVSVIMAFILQRTLVLAGINERNATIGTLAFVLSPLYFMLSVTFMSDITGLFAIVLCLYGCLHALRSSTDRAAILWLCLAVLTNAIFGTARQIAWLGVLVMVPSTLWLLRMRRKVFLAGAAADLLSVLFVFACMHWFALQPYSVPEHVLPKAFPLVHTLGDLTVAFLDAPLLLLPVVALFFPQIRKNGVRFFVAASLALLLYLFLALYPSHLRGNFPLEPMPGSMGEWVNAVGTFAWPMLHGSAPIFLNRTAQVLLTIASLGGLLGFLVLLLRNRRSPPVYVDATAISWNRLGLLLGPFTVSYLLLLVPRAADLFGLHDRYLLAPLLIALIALVRYYQERLNPQLPSASLLLVAIVAVFSIASTHNMFSFYRARVAMASALVSHGVPDTAVDNGWEYNFGVELHHADHLNFPTVVIPAHAYVPQPPPPPGLCTTNFYMITPHIHALYGISFDPDACDGPAPFAPVHYARWLGTPGTLYVVRYTPPSKP